MTYLYRDAGNYKHWQDVVFPNQTGLNATELTQQLRPHLFDSIFFEQKLAPIPIEYTEIYDPELDHTWLEFHSFEEVVDEPQVEQDVVEFVESFGPSSNQN